MKIQTKMFLLGLSVMLMMASAVVQAAEVTARLDRNQVVVGETVTLVLQTNDTAQSLENDLGALEADFDIIDHRSETQMSFVNGRKTAYVRVVITLEPKRQGRLTIPALQFPGATSQPLNLTVNAAPTVAPGEPEPVFIEVTVLPDTGPYYVLSQVGLMVRIFYQANLTEAAINPPAPTQASVRLLDEVPYQAERNGVKYRVLERRYAIFPERSGTLTIPPMQLSGRLIERPKDRLWQPTVRGRRVRVKSAPLVLDISPRPAAFTGNSWLPARRITLSQKISDSAKLHVGEPVTRTVILDAVGLEEHMLEEPVWPDVPDTRVYPDQPQGISRDDGEWVLGHKEFRYAIVPEQEGELVLPEVKLEWWDTVAHKQRTAVLPEYTVTVLPSELSPTVAVAPPVNSPMAVGDAGVFQSGSNDSAVLWKSMTVAFALLWLLTWFYYYRRGLVVVAAPDKNTVQSVDEKTLLKQFQQSCQENDASAARKLLAQWIRHHAPINMRGSMREFGLGCGDRELQMEIAGLDASGFASDNVVIWNGDNLWSGFNSWQSRPRLKGGPEVGQQPELYR